MRFIDLFAGLGGFHLALSRLGHECVFACELDSSLRDLYNKNFDLEVKGDIRAIATHDIPPHEILCAGFPCQPFSKAGEQNGFKDSKSGDLFDYVLRIIQRHHPSYILLENVPHLLRHDGGNTWLTVERKLTEAGYYILTKRLSPHRFGIPQIRDRVFIVGSRTGLEQFSWPEEKDHPNISLETILDRKPADARLLSAQVLRCLAVWQDFIDRFPKELELPSFPIWSMEFGATYPYEKTTPFATKLEELRRHKGSHGRSLAGLSNEAIMPALPSHARTNQLEFPKWKIDFIRQNRNLYEHNKEWIDAWMPKILEFPSSLQKLEWNCKGEKRDISKYVIQFRASGVRVKRPTTAPSLVAMTSTQVPIIAWENRYMTPKECARLQSMEELKFLPNSPTKAFEALGNAVNVEIVALIAKALLCDRTTAVAPATATACDTSSTVIRA